MGTANYTFYSNCGHIMPTREAARHLCAGLVSKGARKKELRGLKEKKNTKIGMRIENEEKLMNFLT